MKNGILVFLLFCGTIFGADFADFDKYQNVFTREEIAAKIEKYLEKDKLSSTFYEIREEGLCVGDLEKGEIDYTLKFAKNQSEKTISLPKTLKGAKIALDPGHFGGIYAELERRIVKLPKEIVGSDNDICFEEGTLTFLTAIALKNLLEEAGAIVFVTRANIGRGAIEKSFFSWLDEKPQLWKVSESLPSLFKIYNSEDLKERARKINEFNPDITVIIHYNGHEDLDEPKKITHANFNLVFIPGAFRKGELATKEMRYEFLRLCVTNTIEESLILSQCLAKEFVTHLNVPLITDNDKNTYTKPACLKIENGIYARNLSLTRLVHSPLCYGETLIQNNEQEALNLDTHDTEINNILCSSRLKTVAEAYFAGIKKYYAAD